MRPHITMITLGVEDLKRSTEFYQRLGFPLSEHSQETVSFFELEGAWLGLFPREELGKDVGVELTENGYQRVTLAHNLGSKEEVDTLFKEVEKAGATIIKEPRDVFWGGYSGYFADPDDFLWEVAWNPYM